MAQIKSVDPKEAQAKLQSVQRSQVKPAPSGVTDALIALGELFGKGLATAGGNEMAINLANDIKASNDARRLRPFYDSLASGENPAMPANLGAEAQQQAVTQKGEKDRETLMATLQLLQQMQGVANAQAGIDAQAENLNTQETGQNNRLTKQLMAQETIAAADRTSQERQNQARVGVAAEGNRIQQDLGDKQVDLQHRELGHKIYNDLQYPPTPRAVSNAPQLKALLDFAQTTEMPPAQAALIQSLVMGQLQGMLSGQLAGGTQGAVDANDPALRALLEQLSVGGF